MYNIGDWVRDRLTASDPRWPKRVVDKRVDPDNLSTIYYVEGVGWFEEEDLIGAKA